MDKVRLNKYLADCGICSRREADRLIEQGLVTVNGRSAAMGCRVTEQDRIAVGGKQLSGKPRKVVLAFYKPVGVTCTERDRHAEKLIRDYVQYPVRVTYAGRLDKDSEGLLLLTNDGDLIEAVMRGAHGHEKEYTVKVDREITAQLLDKMAAGVYLRELRQTTRPCQVRQTGKFTFQITLTQGLNRQIRRMCQACGYEVRQLKRIRIMNIELGTLSPGEYREVQGQELEQLYRDAGSMRSRD
ncbi:MAG: pseudouridine synthase [bacterium]|nr:pseudouridine synthase [bacterium]MCM1376364.1 pseudouridine synthase [Muribaculum sp.]